MKNYLELNNELMRKEDGFFQLEKDLDAVKAFELEVENQLMKFKCPIERIDWLIKNNYYIDFFKMYSKEDILKVVDKVYNYNFKFKSYMAISKFYQSYSMKTNDKSKFLERYEDRIVAVALYLAQGNINMAMNLATSMIEQRYQPATPTFLNAGKVRGGELVSCFLLSMDDSLNSINYVLNTCAQLSKIGGGVAINVSKLRSRNEAIKGIENASSGVMPVLKLLEDTFSYVNQLGQRPGAGVAYLNIFHADIEEFLDTKKINASEKARLQTLSIGLIVPNKFMELAKNGEDMYVFAPYTVFKATGQHLDDLDMDKYYDELVTNPNIKKKKLNPRKILIQIAKMQFESGYPYMMFKDNANSVHALKELGQIKMSNLCVTGDTRLHTNFGLIKAKDLYENQANFKVTIDNRTKDLNVNNMGVDSVNAIQMQLTAKSAEIYKIKTQQGYEIRATEWHKFYRQVGNKIEKVSLNELNTGDKLLIQSDEGTYGLFDDTELAFITGVINGDGSITEDTAKIYLYGEKSSLKSQIEAMVSKIIERYGSREYRKGTPYSPKFTYDEVNNKWTLVSKRLFDVLAKFNINKATKTRVPEFVFGGSKEVVGAFLSGLYKMDGTVNAIHKSKAMTYELVTTNEFGVKDIQILLSNSGIFSTIYEYKPKTELLPDGKGSKAEYKANKKFKIVIQDRQSRDRFSSFVELKSIDEEKINSFNSILQPKSRKAKHKYTTIITSIEFDGVEDVYDTTQPEYHSLIFNGIVTGNCTEIFQLQETSIINDYGIEDVIKRDVCCNLGSLNIVNVMEKQAIEESVYSAMDALTQVTDLSDIKNAPGVKKANKELHAVGLGVMNLHGYFAKNIIAYESEYAKEFANQFFMMINYYSIKRSMEIAMKKGKVFEGFEKSEYANGKYFEKYINNDYTAKSDKVKKLFGDMYIPTKEDWYRLAKEVKENGLYHAYRLAIAPTQSIGYIQNATAGITPITDVIERRTYGDSTTYYPMPYLNRNNMLLYKSAFNMNMFKMIDLVSVIQEHIDQGISATLFIDSETSTKDLARYYIYAHKKGLKALYYTRTKNLAFEECLVCSV